MNKQELILIINLKLYLYFIKYLYNFMFSVILTTNILNIRLKLNL
jgi:hypothetical protein